MAIWKIKLNKTNYIRTNKGDLKLVFIDHKETIEIEDYTTGASDNIERHTPCEVYVKQDPNFSYRWQIVDWNGYDVHAINDNNVNQEDITTKANSRFYVSKGNCWQIGGVTTSLYIPGFCHVFATRKEKYMAIEKILYDFDAYLRQKKWEQSYIVPKQVKSTGGISLDNYTMSFKQPTVCKVLGYSKKSDRKTTYDATIPFDVYILELKEDVAAESPDTRGITSYSAGDTFFCSPEDCTPITQNGGVISLLTHVYQAVTAPRKVAVACR